MTTLASPISTGDTRRVTLAIGAWLPLLVLPPAMWAVARDGPAWMQMWSLAVAIYAGFKWLTYVDSPVKSPSLARSLAYLLLWPGMDAGSFLDASQTTRRPGAVEWVAAVFKLVTGVVLIVLSRRVIPASPHLGGWIGMTGIVLGLHFGLLHLLSVVWRSAGIHAVPIMRAPLLASTLSDFWGRRWNLAFRDLAHRYVFRPSSKTLGAAAATLAVFIVSGLIHDVVISIPAGAGFGRPTCYFLIQGVGLLWERGRIGRRFGFGRGLVGRLYAVTVVLGPAGWLFHRPFIEHVVIPLLQVR